MPGSAENSLLYLTLVFPIGKAYGMQVVVVKPEDSAAAGSEKVALAAGATAGGVAGVAGSTGNTVASKEPIVGAPVKAPPPGGRFGFIDRWFQPPPSPFGNIVRVPILANSPTAAGLKPYTPNSAMGMGRTEFSAPGQGLPPYRQSSLCAPF